MEIKKKEFIFLSLRTIKGIDIKKYNYIFNEDFYHHYNKIIMNNKEYFNISIEYLSIKNYYFNYVDEISLLLL